MKGLPQKQDVIQRDDFIKIIQSAIQLNHYRFAIEMVDQWLSIYPQDIVISYYKALLLYLANPTSTASHQEAIKLLENICQKDAEYGEAVNLLSQLNSNIKNSNADSFKEIYLVLSGKSESLSQIWSRSLYKARTYYYKGNFEEAEQLIQETLKIVLPSPKIAKGINNLDALLSAVTHIQILYRKAKQNSIAEAPSLLSLVEFYHNIWDKNLVFKLIQADLLMEGGRSDEAVNILHQTAFEDISGDIAIRCFGKNHPYLSLWTKDISIKINTSIPASIAALLGWNQLPSPTETDSPFGDKNVFTAINTSYDTPTTIDSEVQNQQASVDKSTFPADDDLLSTLDEIAKNLRAPLPSQTDARFPVYVILSSKELLKKQYGEDGFKKIDEALVKLAAVTNQLPEWNARILYVDDAASAAANGIKPVLASDPWAIKLSLKDLDKALQKTGEMIGALLIVGGHEIIPFHSLPNPVDDPDPEVFSDNPYGTRDENYFVPEWSVGRITTGTSSEATKLIEIIERIIEDRTYKNDKKPWYFRLIEILLNWLSPNQNLKKTSIGYTAAIWKDASLAVFKTIGDSKDLLISPPINFSSFSNGKINPSKLGYFNLHGVEDSPEWYGQRDPMDSFFTDSDTPHRLWDDDYPIALRPQNLEGNNHTPEVIFTEACYGAFINQKNIDDALSLKFLSSGTKAFAGSTSTAYGSVTTPLTAADLLSKLFWQYIQDGCSAGSALMQAKISLAKEMNQRQGYLDGEDQKTLIQFILLGDPLAKFTSLSSKGRAAEVHQTSRSIETSQVITIQEKSLSEETFRIDPLTLETVKETVAKYLPGMTNAEMNISQMISSLSQPQDKISAQSTTKTYNTEKLPYQVITLRKSVSKYSVKHIHIARLTVDQKGNIIKMTYSR